jgi:hypothetical protein
MRGQFFEYVVLHHPQQTKEQAERNEHPKSVVICGLDGMIATSEKEVGIRAAREIPAEYLDKINEVEILIRPFGESP